MKDELKCPECGKVLHGSGSLGRHRRTKHPDSRRERGNAGPTSGGKPSQPEAAAQPDEPSGTFAYPSMSEWRRSKDEEPTPPPGPAGIAGGAVPVALDLTSVWMWLGNFIDEHMPEDSKAKIDVSPKMAETLNEGLRQMGLYTIPNPTIIVPNWTGFVVTFGLTFGLPLLVIAKDFLEKLSKKATVGGRESGESGRSVAGKREDGPLPIAAANPADVALPEDVRNVMAPVGPAGPRRQEFREPEAG